MTFFERIISVESFNQQIDLMMYGSKWHGLPEAAISTIERAWVSNTRGVS
jgi:hypothetical protein